jgi:hypothetical protein
VLSVGNNNSSNSPKFRQTLGATSVNISNQVFNKSGALKNNFESNVQNGPNFSKTPSPFTNVSAPPIQFDQFAPKRTIK